MALRDAFSRFLRGKAESRRDKEGKGSSDGSTALDKTADAVDAGEDPDLVVLVERLEGFYVPDRDEFVPTGVAVEIIEGFEDEDPKVLVRALGDAASDDAGNATQSARDEAKR
ncbi:MAG: hypothetical protein QOF10_1970 [Kribbellaceae bacterium]|jgi:hypothetical protein|nr:hypothetical protein [Kribbellaceae bacterium]